MPSDYDANLALPYRSPVSTKVFLGEVWLDDVVAITYNVQDEKQPIYGFKSRLFDDVTIGRTSVTGQLICHFRYPGYLTNVIKAAKKRNDLPIVMKARKTPGVPLSLRDYPSNVSLLNQELAKSGAAAIQAIAAQQQSIWWDVKPSERSEDRAGYLQGTENKKFDLRIVYGRIDQPTEAMFIRIIEDVHLVGEAQEVSMLDGSGDMCLMEVYTFFARQVKSAL